MSRIESSFALFFHGNELTGIRCRKHHFVDEHGGLCPSCARYAMHDIARGAPSLRDVLLAIPENVRAEVLAATGICVHCGGDLMREDGTIARCWCNVRTPTD